MLTTIVKQTLLMAIIGHQVPLHFAKTKDQISAKQVYTQWGV